MQASDAHATIRAALEYRRSALVMELSNWLDGHPMLVKYQAEIAAIDAALAYLDTLAAGQYQPIEGHIIMVISGEIQDVQAHSISGLPLPEGVAVCKMIGDGDA